MFKRHLLAGLALCAVAGCSNAPVEDGESATSHLESAPAPSRANVEAAIATLDAHRGSEELAPYYADGSRLDGCFRNPAGNKLSDLQKTFYCAMPLELRLCNTVKLLTIDESKVDERYAAYLACQKKVDAVFGGKGAFVYDDNVNAVYKTLFLSRAPLAEEDTAAVIAKHKPALTSRPFAFVLVEIGVTLTKEATDLALGELSSMADDYRDETKTEPR